MGLVTPGALRRRLAGKPEGGTIFLFGLEEFLKEEAVAALVAAHLDPATRDFNLDQLRGADVTPESLSSILQTPPMMAEWRVVVLRDAQHLAGSPRLRAAVEAVLDRPIPGLVLILVATLPERSRAQFYERLKREATSVEFPALRAEDVPGWLMERARAAGLELEVAAARGLAAAVGTELGVLVRELTKLGDYVGERQRITLADVESAVGSVPRENRWDWIDKVAEGRFREARQGLTALLDAGETGVGLVIGLGTQFLRLGVLLAGGQRALEQALPAHQRWLARRIAGQARRWTTSSVDSALDDLLRADRLLKSAASLGERAALEELLLRLEGRVGAAGPA